MLFEGLYKTADPQYRREALDTYAGRLRARLQGEVQKAVASAGESLVETDAADGAKDQPAQPADFLSLAREGALKAVNADAALRRALDSENATWGVVWFKLRDALPETLQERDELANQLVPEFLNEVFGKGNWHTQKRLTKKGEQKPFIKKGAKP